MANDYKYWAFISYSHADKKWGDWLHGALETYKVPKALVGNQTQRGEPVPLRVFPIFRDREELPTNSDLGSVISEALKQSRYLIVICSPRAAQSRWVNQEILDYKKLGRENRILALIVDGEPNAADGKLGIAVEAESFPEALKYLLGKNGEIDKTRRTEPIAADVRPEKDGKTNAKLKLLAGILGVNYDDLKRRDEQRRRRRRVLVVLATFVLVTMIGGGWFLQERAKLRAQAMTYVKQAQTSFDSVSYYARANWLSESHLAEANVINYLTDINIPKQIFTHGSNVLTADFSPNGKMLITGGDDKTARLWDVGTGKQLGKIMTNSGVVVLAGFSGDGKKIFTGTRGGTVRVWDSQTCESIGPGVVIAGTNDPEWIDPDFGNNFQYHCSFFGADGNILVKTGGDSEEDGFESISFFDTRRGILIGKERIHPLAGNRGSGFSPDGEKIFIITADGFVCLLDVRTRQMLCRSLVPKGATIFGSFSPDSKMFITRSCGKQGGETIRFWDTKDGKPIGKVIYEEKNSQGVFCNPDGKTVFTTLHATNVVWNISTGQPIANYNYNIELSSSDKLSPDGKSVLRIGSLRIEKDVAELWELKQKKSPLLKTMKYSGNVIAVAFSQNGKSFIVADKDKSINLWDLNSGHYHGRLARQLSTGMLLAISKSENYLLAGGWDVPAQILDAKNQKQPKVLLPKQLEVLSGAFDPTGKIVATGNANYMVQLWDAHAGTPIGIPMVDETGVYTLAFSTDGRTLVSGTGCSNGHRLRPGVAQLWNVKTCTSVRKIQASEFELNTVGFSLNGETLFTGGEDQKVRFWDPTSGESIGSDLELNEKVIAAAFSLDGKVFLTASADNLLQFWDVSWLMSKPTPSILLLKAQVATHRDVTDYGQVRDIPFSEWLSLFKKYQSLNTN